MVIFETLTRGQPHAKLAVVWKALQATLWQTRCYWGGAATWSIYKDKKDKETLYSAVQGKNVGAFEIRWCLLSLITGEEANKEIEIYIKASGGHVTSATYLVHAHLVL